MTGALQESVSVHRDSTPYSPALIADRIEHWIDTNPGQAFGLLTILFFLIALTLSSLKLLWLDELITLHIARLATVGGIWHALANGADPNPPLTHILVHFSLLIFGEHEFALRLPAMVGYWVGLASLFAYLRRHLPPIWALSGTMLSMTMAAFDYSFDSRSYAIFYGFSILAFLCWSEAVDQPKRALRSSTRPMFLLVGMVVALAAAISTNYFAVLAFLPIAAGECIRTARNLIAARLYYDRSSRTLLLWRAIDARVWIALGLAASPLLIYRPLIARSIAEFGPYAWNKVSLGQVIDSYTQMVEIILYPILALFVIAAIVFAIRRFLGPLCVACRGRLRPRWCGEMLVRFDPRLPLPLSEAVGIATFMAYPILGYIVAKLYGGMLSPRFVIPVCFGFAVAGIVVAYQLFRRMPHAGLALLALCLSWLLARESVVGYWYAEQKQCFYKVLAHIPEAEKSVPPGAPIAIPDPLLVLTFEHYASPSQVSRVVFPLDFPAIRLYRHDDSPERNLWAGRGSLYSLNIEPLATLQHDASSYLIIASDGNWLLSDLQRHNNPVTRLPIDTRAAAIGGFTPLARGTPVFYTVHGDRTLLDDNLSGQRSKPFNVVDNLPSAGPLTP